MTEQVTLQQLIERINAYKMGEIVYPYCVVNAKLDKQYENDYMVFDCFESSNTRDAQGKMWSIVYYPKKDFTNINTYKSITHHFRIRITPRRKDKKGRYAIRFYDMHKNPDKQIVSEILNHLFG